MKGRIEIIVDDYQHTQVRVDMKGLSHFGKALLMDSLGKALKLDETDRMTIGALIAIGGFGALSGRSPEMVEVDLGMIDKIKKMKEKDDDEH